MPRISELVTVEDHLKALGYTAKEIETLSKTEVGELNYWENFSKSSADTYSNWIGQLLSDMEKCERKVKLWEGHVKENGHRIVKRNEDCEYCKDLRFDASVLSFTENGETRAYVYKPGERDNIDFVGEYIFAHSGMSISGQSMNSIYKMISDEVKGIVYKDGNSGKVVNIIPFEEMLL